MDLILSLDDALVGAAIHESQEQEVTLEAFVEDAIRQVLSSGEKVPVKTVNLQEVLHAAVQKAQSIATGTRFHLTDVCDDATWGAMETGERKSLGKDFRRFVEANRIAKHVGRTTANKAIYERL